MIGFDMQYRSPSDAGQARKLVFDFPDFDALPANFDLFVRAPVKIKQPVFAPGNQITSAIKGFIGLARRIRDEFFLRHVRHIDIAAVKSCAAKVNLARDAKRYPFSVFVKYPDKATLVDAAERDAFGLGGPWYQIHGGMNCRLGRAIAVPDIDGFERGIKPADECWLHDFAARDQTAQFESTICRNGIDHAFIK